MRDLLAVTAAILATFSTVPYIIDIVKGRTKPNIVSWLTWTLLTGIATAAAFAAGEPRSALLTLGASICTTAVLLLGFRYGIAKFSLFDGLCQTGAIVGLILWLVFGSPAIAIVASVTIDLIGALPTIRHAWLKPAEETWQTFLIGTVAAVLTVLSLNSYSVEGLLYPLYLIFANGAIAAIVVYKRKQIGISLSRHSVHETLHE